MSINTTALMNSVCSIRSDATGYAYQGQGVFIRPDVVLTSWHNLEGTNNITVIDKDGAEARMVRGSAFNKRRTDLDVATLQIDKPLGTDVAQFTDSDTVLKEKGGFLVSRFTGAAKGYKIEIDRAISFDDLVTHENLDPDLIMFFKTKIKTQEGYSGAPIFDTDGKLASIHGGSARFEINGSFLGRADRLHSTFGPQSGHLASFLRYSLGL